MPQNDVLATVIAFTIIGLPAGVRGKKPACQRRRHKRGRFDPWVEKIPWRRKWQLATRFLPEKFHEQRSLAGYSPWDHKELDTTKRTHTRTKGNAASN